MAANSEQSAPLDFSMRRKNAPSPLDLSNTSHGTSDALRNTSAPVHQSNRSTLNRPNLPHYGAPSMLQQLSPAAAMPPSAGSVNSGPTNVFLPPSVFALNAGPSNGGVTSPATTDPFLPSNAGAQKPHPKKSLFAPHADLSHPSAPILPLRAPVSNHGPIIPHFPLNGGLTIPGSANSFFAPNAGVPNPGPTNFLFPLNPGQINVLLPPNPGSANLLAPSNPGPSNSLFPSIPGGSNVFFPPNSNITWELEKLGISDTSSASSTPTTPNTPNTPSALGPPTQFDRNNTIGPIRTSEYIEKRRKNNESARRSRTRKRELEDDLAHRTELLEQQNVQLKCKLAHIQHQIDVAQAAIMQKNINNQQFRYNWNGFR